MRSRPTIRTRNLDASVFVCSWLDSGREGVSGFRPGSKRRLLSGDGRTGVWLSRGDSGCMKDLTEQEQAWRRNETAHDAPTLLLLHNSSLVPRLPSWRCTGAERFFSPRGRPRLSGAGGREGSVNLQLIGERYFCCIIEPRFAIICK